MELYLLGSGLCLGSILLSRMNFKSYRHRIDFLEKANDKALIVTPQINIETIPDDTLIYTSGKFIVNGEVKDKLLQIDFPDQPIIEKKVFMYQYKDRQSKELIWSDKRCKNWLNPVFPTTNNTFLAQKIELNGFFFNQDFIQKYLLPRSKYKLTSHDIEKVPLQDGLNITPTLNESRIAKDKQAPSWENKLKFLLNGDLMLQSSISPNINTLGDLKIQYFCSNVHDLSILGAKRHTTVFRYLDLDKEESIFSVSLQRKTVDEMFQDLKDKEFNRLLLNNLLLGGVFLAGLGIIMNNKI